MTHIKIIIRRYLGKIRFNWITGNIKRNQEDIGKQPYNGLMGYIYIDTARKLDVRFPESSLQAYESSYIKSQRHDDNFSINYVIMKYLHKSEREKYN